MKRYLINLAKTLRNAFIRQWGFILLALVSISFYAFTEQLASLTIAILSVVITILKEIIETRKFKQLESIQMAKEMKQLAQDFFDRFVNPGSAYSIIVMLREMANYKPVGLPQLSEWATGCLQVQDPLTRWLQLLIRDLNSVEINSMTSKELNRLYVEFDSINCYYYNLVKTFYNKWDVCPPENLKNNFNMFVPEYNAYVPEARAKLSKALGYKIDISRIGFLKLFP